MALPLAGRSPLRTQGWGWSAAWGSTPRSVSWNLCAVGSCSVLASPPPCSRTKRLYQTHQPPPPWKDGGSLDFVPPDVLQKYSD